MGEEGENISVAERFFRENGGWVELAKEYNIPIFEFYHHLGAKLHVNPDFAAPWLALVFLEKGYLKPSQAEEFMTRIESVLSEYRKFVRERNLPPKGGYGMPEKRVEVFGEKFLKDKLDKLLKDLENVLEGRKKYVKEIRPTRGSPFGDVDIIMFRHPSKDVIRKLAELEAKYSIPIDFPPASELREKWVPTEDEEFPMIPATEEYMEGLKEATLRALRERIKERK